MKTSVATAIIFTLMSTGVCQAAEPAEWQSKALDLVKLKHGVINARWRSVKKNALWVSMEASLYHAASFSHFVCEAIGVVGAPSGTVTSISVFDPPSYRDNGWPMGTAECR